MRIHTSTRVFVGAALGSVVVATFLTVVLTLAGGARRDLTPADAAPAVQRTAEPKPRALTIGWVGDTILGSRDGVPPDDGRELLRPVRGLLTDPDLMLGNLEGTLSVGGVPKCGAGAENCFTFQAPPSHAETFRWAGFDLMNLANNHAFDHGEEGLTQTVGALGAAGVRHTGRPGQITVVERHGTKIAVLGFAPYAWAARIEDLHAATALVKEATRRADVVVVTMHAGAEGADQTHTPVGVEAELGEQRGDTRAFAHAVVDAGADLVLGSGPHVVRGIERYAGRLIAYSLGNFAGYNTFSQAGEMALSGLLRVRVTREGRPVAGRWVSLTLQGPGTPVVDPAHTSAARVRQLSREDFGTAGAVVGADGRLALR